MGERASTVEEIPFRLEVNGGVVAQWACSPGALETLAAGWLLAEGFIAARADVRALTAGESDGRGWARAEVAPDRHDAAQALREHRRAEGCGALHYVQCAPFGMLAGGRGVPGDDAWASLFEQLFAFEDARHGGTHVAALSDGERLLHVVGEVGRHNAADRAIGGALLEGTPLEPLGLVLSARISGEIAWKAARARLSWVASRSIPSTLATAVASAAGLHLIGRAAGRERIVHPPRPRHAPPLGVILVGGRNVRFGAHKALASVGGRRIIDRVRDALEPVTGMPVLIANDAAAYAGLGLDFRGDARRDAGALGGIHTALLWARELGRSGALVVAGDMPFVTRELLQALTTDTGGADMCLAESGGRRGVEPLCAYYGASCIDAIERSLERGDHRVIGFHDDMQRVRRLPLSEVQRLGAPETLFMNVNTPEELARAEAVALEPTP